MDTVKEDIDRSGKIAKSRGHIHIYIGYNSL
jgi:hypothetical protein